VTIVLGALLVCTILLGLVLLRTYGVQSSSIPWPSRAPTPQPDDRIMVNKLSSDFHSVHRGDTVVFRRPPLAYQDFADIVKRVVGLAGQSVATQYGHAYINGELLSEPCLSAGADPLRRGAP
jgi:signal peptidase I